MIHIENCEENVPDFESLFFKSRKNEIEYEGKTLIQYDEFAVSNGDKLLLVFESTNSEWRQGVFLQIDGDFEIIGQSVPHKMALWEDTAPKQNEFIVWETSSSDKKTVFPKKVFLTLENSWKTSNGGIFSRFFGSAMYVEEIENGRRYFCNDGHPDDNFDDLVFTLQKIGNVEEERSGQPQDSSRENPKLECC